MSARSTKRCEICDSPLTAAGLCLECERILSLKERKTFGSSKKKDKQTKENVPVDRGKIIALRRQKKATPCAFLFNQSTAERLVLSGELTRIGRDRSNDIAIDKDPYISRHHAWILQAQGGFWIEDLGSTNTTLLNGEPVKERSQIIAGDKLTFGKTELKFFAEK